MTNFKIVFNNGKILNYPFSYMDIVGEIVGGGRVECYLIEDGNEEILINSGKLDFNSGNGDTFNNLQDIVDTRIKDAELVKSVLDKHSVVSVSKLVGLLNSERVDFIPKSEGLYVEVCDEDYIPVAYYTIDDFLGYKNSILEDLYSSPLSHTEKDLCFRLVVVLNDVGGLKKRYVSKYKYKTDNLSEVFTNLDEFISVFGDMNKLSKIYLVNSEIEVI